MPLSAATITLAVENVQHDIVNGFTGVLSPTTDPFLVELKDVNSALAVATSDGVVAVPWVYPCVHTGDFLGVAATYINVELRGTTFVEIPNEEDVDRWLYHRFIDYLCVLHSIGVYTANRPVLNPSEYLNWADQVRS